MCTFGVGGQGWVGEHMEASVAGMLGGGTDGGDGGKGWAVAPAGGDHWFRSPSEVETSHKVWADFLTILE